MGWLLIVKAVAYGWLGGLISALLLGPLALGLGVYFGRERLYTCLMGRSKE